MRGASGPGPPTVLTPQLRLRAPRTSDLDALFAIQGDADAMRYTWCAPDRDATARHVEGYARRFEVDGVAPWTAVERRTRRVVGWGGLGVDPLDPEGGVEVSFFFAPRVWGRGLATELVRASLAWAFGDLALPAVSASVHPDNDASRRVLERCGFARVASAGGPEREVHRVGRGDWLAARAR